MDHTAATAISTDQIQPQKFKYQERNEKKKTKHQLKFGLEEEVSEKKNSNSCSTFLHDAHAHCFRRHAPNTLIDFQHPKSNHHTHRHTYIICFSLLLSVTQYAHRAVMLSMYFIWKFIEKMTIKVTEKKEAKRE